MRWYSVLFAVLILVVAVIARSSSSGRGMISASESYLTSLSEGRLDEAYSVLSDSLAGMVSPDFIGALGDQQFNGGTRIGRMDQRGYRLSLVLEGGGSRTIWLQQDPDGTWRITGDTSLDNLLGQATVLCNEFAQNTVSPAVRVGANPSDYLCPVTGEPYLSENGFILCPAGHLGEGIDAGGRDCSIQRDSLSGLLEHYLEAGFPYPESFLQMYETSSGEFGQRGGFRCPDNGYAYYEITPEGIFCPFHEELSPILVGEAQQQTGSL